MVSGDPNQDGNDTNDRLPGVGRDSFIGPDYATTDARLTRRLYVRERVKLDLVVESFNLLNRDNKRVLITENGLEADTAYFVKISNELGVNYYPGHFQIPSNPLRATQCLCAKADAVGYEADFLNCVHNTKGFGAKLRRILRVIIAVAGGGIAMATGARYRLSVSGKSFVWLLVLALALFVTQSGAQTFTGIYPSNGAGSLAEGLVQNLEFADEGSGPTAAQCQARVVANDVVVSAKEWYEVGSSRPAAGGR